MISLSMVKLIEDNGCIEDIERSEGQETRIETLIQIWFSKCQDLSAICVFRWCDKMELSTDNPWLSSALGV